MDRILFAVSVFHAFGHWWACQIVYHPLKCIGFGLTNREGCECFWHSISNLIAYLRVSGYHRRLFTLDFQIEQDNRASLGRLAAWLNRRTINCEEKLRQALADLEACGVSETVLRAQWKDQVDVQTRPLKPRKTAEVVFTRVKSMEETMADASSETHECVYADLHLPEARTALKQVKEKAKHLEQELGIQDTTLRARKFELDPIERSFRWTRSKNQRNDHASQAIKRQEPNISKLLKTYNKLCEEIASLIRNKKAPKGAVAPPPIPEKGLYQLDVDDAIWQDAGLEDVDGEPPRWLTDDNDRCEEEAPRLLREREHLQIWFATEWKVVCELMADSEGTVQYQFKLRRQELLELYVCWKKSLDRIAFDDTGLPEWEPSNEEVLGCQISNATPFWVEGIDGEASDEEESEEEEEDDDIFQIMEAVERADNHRASGEGRDFW
ncbi:hypothetical protein B0H14DRAFT_3092472 [Mycena olivaceomarginata]|nr:hypothetical protein B0H14DRAFT_3092472 [Mycena olivaceomarginata]